MADAARLRCVSAGGGSRARICCQERGRGGVAAALAGIQIPVVAVAIDSDRLFPVRLQAEIAELAPFAAPLITISSPFGHDGFLVEVELVGDVIRSALALA